MCEIHLFIIWSKAYGYKDEIIKDIKSKFKILGIHKVSWSKDNFSKNLTRFYGENLPQNSNKERLCGNGPFTLVVVEDEKPLYRVRKTSKGSKTVNVNIFDSKEMYRNWTGGGHMIHGTNDMAETKHDLILLTGMNVNDYISEYEKKRRVLDNEFFSMVGEDKWNSPEEVLYVMNETLEYVILRNFDGIFSNYDRQIHGDVDILVKDPYAAKLVLNAKPTKSSKHRVQHVVKINEGGTYFDIRYVGDKYYCRKFEEQILKQRYLTERNYYRTDEYNYKYSLLYHALVQKKSVSNDYDEIFQSYFLNCYEDNEKNKIEYLAEELNNFIAVNGYEYCEPDDYSVYFNKNIVHKTMSFKKFMLKAFHKIFK